MAKNIEMNLKLDSGSYEVMYPQTLGSLVNGKVTSATNADSATTATKLANPRTIQTNLANTSSASFDGSGNITPGVTGTLPLSNGGTNGTSASAGLYNLINGCGLRNANEVNNYASNTYLGSCYGSIGYKIPISNLLTYIQNNISFAGLTSTRGSYTGSGTEPTITVSGLTTLELIMISGYITGGTTIFGTKYNFAFLIMWKDMSNRTSLNTTGLVIYANENTSFWGSDGSNGDLYNNILRIRGGGGLMVGFGVSGSTYYWIALGT